MEKMTSSAETTDLGKIINERPIDVALVGVGENGHLAFNDPPADFETEKPYLVVNLDEPCRKQQMGEGLVRFIGRSSFAGYQYVCQANHEICTHYLLGSRYKESISGKK
jgi:glucosamine-6-phosphate deaminase